jgi:hypothetical protein
VATDKARVSTYIENSLKEDVLKIATIQGRTLSNYIEQLIKKDAERARKAQEID